MANQMKTLTAQELRIGNLVYGVSDRIEKVVAINTEWVVTSVGKLSGKDLIEISDISPIPLTEEWLIKFGFEISDGGYDYISDKLYLWRLEGNGYRYDHPFHPVYIKYVHQLQNLYYALTGEELTHA